jgi:hypothetical protein
MEREASTAHPSRVAEVRHSPSLQATVKDLQRLLGVEVEVGQIRLNLNEGQVQSFETRTFRRLAPPQGAHRLTK